MSLLVGCPVDGRAGDCLELARLMAVSARLPLVVCCVIPDRYGGVVGPGRAVDAEYSAHLRSLATNTLTQARQWLERTGGTRVRYEIVTARSVPSGMLQAIDTFDPSLVVCGSAEGAWGRIALGSVTDYLLHSSPVPVALAHRGAHYDPHQRVRRVTVALDGTSATSEVLEHAAQLARDLRAALRLVVFALRPGPMVPSLVGYDAEDRVIQQWRRETRATVEAARSRLHDVEGTPELVISDGRTWSEALDAPGWAETDLLVVGSSSSRSPMSRVFLGSTAGRIIRHSPVPVVVVP